MKKQKTFIQSYLEGDPGALHKNLDSWIERWHLGSTGHPELHQYLGFTKEQYAGWVQDHRYIFTILRDARKKVGQ